MLDALLALPRAHLIVDGYNVTKSTWPELSLEKQRDRLLGGLAPLVARTGAEVTVVFDAAEKKERPLVNRPRGVRVLFAPTESSRTTSSASSSQLSPKAATARGGFE